MVCCRDYATMLCAMLRHQGQPARARCGFTAYLGGSGSTPDFYVDHWVCEVWRAAEDRWVLVDAEMDENERAAHRIEFDTLDVPRDQFLVAGRAWQLCRSGAADPDSFGLGPDSMHGLWYVQSQLVRDLGAMNRMELLCWDCWGLGDKGPDDDVSAEELALLDRVAVLTQAGNDAFGELRAIYESDERLRVPPVVTSYTDAGPREVTLTEQ
ncbi:MAG: transglutaminase domain-containing protein [Promethearchaeota archaeon]